MEFYLHMVGVGWTGEVWKFFCNWQNVFSHRLKKLPKSKQVKQMYGKKFTETHRERQIKTKDKLLKAVRKKVYSFYWNSNEKESWLSRNERSKDEEAGWRASQVDRYNQLNHDHARKSTEQWGVITGKSQEAIHYNQ